MNKLEVKHGGDKGVWEGSVTLPARGLIVRAGAWLAVIGAASARVTEVARATLVAPRAFCVVLAALWAGEHTGHSQTHNTTFLTALEM